MRIGLLTEGGYPYVNSEARLWCDRLVRGLGQHEFDVYALSRSAQQEHDGWVRLPGTVRRVRTAPLWSAPDMVSRVRHGRRARRRFAECYAELAAAVCAGGPVGQSGAQDVDGWRTGIWGSARRVGAPGPREELPYPRAPRKGVAPGADPWTDAFETAGADRFASALYALAAFAREEGAPAGLLCSEDAVRALERACHAPGALRAGHAVRVADLLTVAAGIERVLRPLSLDWYGDRDLGSADLCHATSGGAAALPGLLARHFSGVPLLLTEYGMALRAQYLARPAASAPVRALLTAFHGRLAAETYRRASRITPGSAGARRWQERCGAPRGRLRTVHPGMDAACFADAGESGARGEPGVLVWVGRIEPAKDLVSLLHAFAEVHRALPWARLRIVGAPADGHDAAAYTNHCKALAAQLLSDKSADVLSAGENPVSFEEVPGSDAARHAEAYAAGSVVVVPSVEEGFPVGLVEAMFCGRATVSTDVGAVVEVIGGTGLVVPPRNPRALADACATLLRDPARRALLGVAARERALELFSVEQNIRAFDSLYADIASSRPAAGRRTAGGVAPASGADGGRTDGRRGTVRADAGRTQPVPAAAAGGGAAGTTAGEAAAARLDTVEAGGPPPEPLRAKAVRAGAASVREGAR
jgi:glycosyltransferase involved in cell wall biosynthesis